jgi:hypothetical protein
VGRLYAWPRTGMARAGNADLSSECSPVRACKLTHQIDERPGVARAQSILTGEEQLAAQATQATTGSTGGNHRFEELTKSWRESVRPISMSGCPESTR